MATMEKKNVLYRKEQAERLTWAALETELRKWMGKTPISAGVKSVFEEVKQAALTGKYSVELKIGTVGSALYLRCKRAGGGSVGGHLQDVKLVANWERPEEEEDDEDFRDRCQQAIAAREQARDAGNLALRQVTALDKTADEALASLAELLKVAHSKVKEGKEVREAELATRYLNEIADAKRDAGPIARDFLRVFETHRSDKVWNTFGVSAQDIPGYGQGFVTTTLKNLYAQITAKVDEIDEEHREAVEIADEIRELAQDSGQARAVATRQVASVRTAVADAAKVMKTVGGAEFNAGHTDVARKLANYLRELLNQEDPQNRLARFDMLQNVYDKAVGVTQQTSIIARRLVSASRQLDDLREVDLDKPTKEAVKLARAEIKEVVLEVQAWAAAVEKGRVVLKKARAALG